MLPGQGRSGHALQGVPGQERAMFRLQGGFQLQELAVVRANLRGRVGSRAISIDPCRDFSYPATLTESRRTLASTATHLTSRRLRPACTEPLRVVINS